MVRYEKIKTSKYLHRDYIIGSSIDDVEIDKYLKVFDMISHKNHFGHTVGVVDDTRFGDDILSMIRQEVIKDKNLAVKFSRDVLWHMAYEKVDLTLMTYNVSVQNDVLSLCVLTEANLDPVLYKIGFPLSQLTIVNYLYALTKTRLRGVI